MLGRETACLKAHGPRTSGVSYTSDRTRQRCATWRESPQFIVLFNRYRLVMCATEIKTTAYLEAVLRGGPRWIAGDR